MLWQDQHRSLERIHVPNWEVVDSLFRNANVKLRRQCHLWDDFGWDLSGDLGKTPKNPLGFNRFFPPLFMAILWYLNIDYGYPDIPWYPPCSDTPMVSQRSNRSAGTWTWSKTREIRWDTVGHQGDWDCDHRCWWFIIIIITMITDNNHHYSLSLFASLWEK